jgi:hypothetical protein
MNVSFKRGMPDMDTFRRDLAAAGIEYIDNEGGFCGLPRRGTSAVDESPTIAFRRFTG